MNDPTLLVYILAAASQPAWLYVSASCLLERANAALAGAVAIYVVHLLAAFCVGPAFEHLFVAVTASAPWIPVTIIASFLRKSRWIEPD